MPRKAIRATEKEPTHLSLVLDGKIGVRLDKKVKDIQRKNPGVFISRSSVVRDALKAWL